MLCLLPLSLFLLFSAFLSVPSSLLSRLFSLFLFGVLLYLLLFVVSFNSLHPSSTLFPSLFLYTYPSSHSCEVISHRPINAPHVPNPNYSLYCCTFKI